MSNIGRTYVIGDIHGQYTKLASLLRNAELVNDRLSWIGGTTNLWFMGDFFDRGPDGIAVIDLVMRLQQEAQVVGGQVESLLGNHEVLILAAQRFAEQASGGPGGTFLASWKYNGGQDADLAHLTTQHVEWISSLPAMAHAGEWLLVHADATFYTSYGSSIKKVNQAFKAILQSDNAAAFDQLLDDFAARGEFEDKHPDGKGRAEQFLRTFGGQRLIHGHTPIRDTRPVISPLIYANGLCFNVDSGMYLGHPGFLYELPLEL